MRWTTATLLLDSGVAIEEVQDLLDHKHITTTQIYDKRRRGVLGCPPILPDDAF
jgi:site-specific recombinase XerD